MTGLSVRKAKVILLIVCVWPAFTFGDYLDASSISQASPGINAIAIHQQSTGIDIGLTEAVQEFLAPPRDASQVTDKSAADIKYLPTVPATFFMVLWGFTCVVFVKDRRFLIVTLAAFWWAGQSGIGALPKLISRFAQKNHKGLSSQFSSNLYLENLFESLSLNKESQYMGLLRCLNGIPDENEVKGQFPNSFKQKSARCICLHLDAVKFSQISNSLLKSFVKKTEQFLNFSPAFIFNNLARGPPV